MSVRSTRTNIYQMSFECLDINHDILNYSPDTSDTTYTICNHGSICSLYLTPNWYAKDCQGREHHVSEMRKWTTENKENHGM